MKFNLFKGDKKMGGERKGAFGINDLQGIFKAVGAFTILIVAVYLGFQKAERIFAPENSCCALANEAKEDVGELDRRLDGQEEITAKISEDVTKVSREVEKLKESVSEIETSSKVLANESKNIKEQTRKIEDSVDQLQRDQIEFQKELIEILKEKR